MNPDKFFDKIGVLMGMGTAQARVFVGVFLAASSIATYLGVQAAFELRDRAQPNAGVVFDERAALDTPTAVEKLDERADIPVTAGLDEVLPDGALTDTGSMALCGSHLVGDYAIRYGWAWIEDEGLCRRLRTFR